MWGLEASENEFDCRRVGSAERCVCSVSFVEGVMVVVVWMLMVECGVEIVEVSAYFGVDMMREHACH